VKDIRFYDSFMIRHFFCGHTLKNGGTELFRNNNMNGLKRNNWPPLPTSSAFNLASVTTLTLFLVSKDCAELVVDFCFSSQIFYCVLFTPILFFMPQSTAQFGRKCCGVAANLPGDFVDE
jgi:hypothetical protein